jgi:NADH-quinone oxidoreductase subunit I
LRRIISGIYNLLLGMSVTARVYTRRRVTVKYPYERWEVPERSRGMIVLLSDPETGKLNCTACLLCMKDCPVGCITIEREKGDDGKFHPTRFDIDATICAFCGLCVEACNFSAIKFTRRYEWATYDKQSHFHDMKWLQEAGRDVPYEKPVRPKPQPPLAKKQLTEEEKEELRRKARERLAQKQQQEGEGE